MGPPAGRDRTSPPQAEIPQPTGGRPAVAAKPAEVLKQLPIMHAGRRQVDEAVVKQVIELRKKNWRYREIAEDLRIGHPAIVRILKEFVPPEQARGGAVDGRSDLYAVGAVGSTLPTACQDWAATEAAYRLPAWIRPRLTLFG